MKGPEQSAAAALSQKTICTHAPKTIAAYCSLTTKTYNHTALAASSIPAEARSATCSQPGVRSPFRRCWVAANYSNSALFLPTSWTFIAWRLSSLSRAPVPQFRATTGSIYRLWPSRLTSRQEVPRKTDEHRVPMIQMQHNLAEISQLGTWAFAMLWRWYRGHSCWQQCHALEGLATCPVRKPVREKQNNNFLVSSHCSYRVRIGKGPMDWVTGRPAAHVPAGCALPAPSASCPSPKFRSSRNTFRSKRLLQKVSLKTYWHSNP